MIPTAWIDWLDGAASAWAPVSMDVTIKGTALLLLAGVVCLILRRHSAAVRHMVWSTALLGLLVLPVMELSLPTWSVGPGFLPDRGSVTPTGAESATAISRVPAPVAARESTAATDRIAANGTHPVAPAKSNRSDVGASGAGSTPSVQAGTALEATVERDAVGVAATGVSRAEESAVQFSPAVTLFVLWMAGFVLVLSSVVVGLVRVRWWAARAWRIEAGPVYAMATELAREIGLRRTVRLLLSVDSPMPVTWGGFRPTLLLPRSSGEWTKARLRHVLLHEMTHVVRWDQPLQLMSEAVRALHWFNPFVWLAMSRVRAERERACDDQVLRAGCRASDYAEDLLEVARRFRSGRHMGAVAVPMARSSKLAERLRAILDPGLSRKGVGTRVTAPIAAMTFLLMLPLAAMHPAADSVDQERVRAPRAVAAPTAPGAAVSAASPAPAVPVVAPDGVIPIAPPAPQSPRASQRGPTPPAAEVGPPTAVAPRVPSRASSREPLPPLAGVVAPGGAPAAGALPSVGPMAGSIDVAGVRAPAATVPGVVRSPSVANASTSGPVGVSGGATPLSVAASAPAVQEEHCVFQSGSRQSNSMHSDDDGWDIRWSSDDCWVEIEIRGDVVFRADDRGIERLGDRARFEVEEEVEGSRRRVRMESGSGGTIEVEYWVDGDRQEWDADGEAWLGSFLPQMFRHTTIQSEERARRILDQSGPDGLLAEIDRIESDHVAARYISHLLELAELSSGQVEDVLNTARARLDGDHYLAMVLLEVTDLAGLGPEYRAAYLAAAAELESDHYHHQVLDRMLDQPDLDAAQLGAILDQASAVESDHYQALLLTRLAQADDLPVGGRDAFLQSLRGLQSDHYASQVVHAFLDRGGLSEAELVSVLEMAGSVEGDHYLAQLLERVASDHELDGAARSAYLDVAHSVESDHYLGMIVSAVQSQGELTADQVDMVIELIGTMGSAHYAARSLEGLLEWQLTEAQLGSVLGTLGDLNSDHETSLILGKIAREHTLSEALRDVYVDVAEGLGSRHYRDQAMAALARNGGR